MVMLLCVVAAAMGRYEQLIEQLRGRMHVEQVASQLAIEKYESQVAALKAKLAAALH